MLQISIFLASPILSGERRMAISTLSTHSSIKRQSISVLLQQVCSHSALLYLLFSHHCRRRQSYITSELITWESIISIIVMKRKLLSLSVFLSCIDFPCGRNSSLCLAVQPSSGVVLANLKQMFQAILKRTPSSYALCRMMHSQLSMKR